MPQRSLLTVVERAVEDAVDLTVEHVWPDLGYSAARDEAVGAANIILHVDTSLGRHTSLYRRTNTPRGVIAEAMATMDIEAATGLLNGADALTPVNNSLDSFGLANDDVLDLVEAA